MDDLGWCVPGLKAPKALHYNIVQVGLLKYSKRVTEEIAESKRSVATYLTVHDS